MLERASFETFCVWLEFMAEDVLAHEDAHIEPPPLHTVDAVNVAKYITDYLQRPILSKFHSDMQIPINNPMPVDGYEPYFELIKKLIRVMNGFFNEATGQLKTGVSWLLKGWQDLDINAEIAASDMRMKYEVQDTPHN